ncbi:unnamed protein product [Aphanomyces euteiches]|uniref:Uncharacterized protein n=1 Tax=Aphanomyces euteiches TaxID=100861 RepID=A0A6G0W7E1_9STRA|nr:hypothetical protein Ae201684_018419 [Aphanomyces euteiches]KAH9076117.1 hypothetical protein Ae201684P_012607 [Aphanomyces euteiches]KAH9146774.1 hypothetical protein AeRB84_009358 [Aphanomyces euteiches]
MAEQLPPDKAALSGLSPTPTNGANPNRTEDGAWLFSPPALAPKSPARKSSKSSGGRPSSFFFFSSTPTTEKKPERPVRLQRLQQIPESEHKRRRPRTPIILIASVVVFGVIAAILLFSTGGKASNSSLGAKENDKTTTVAPTTTAAPSDAPSPIPTEASVRLAATSLSEDDNISGDGDGANVKWSKYRFYFVNQCSIPLNIYQKYHGGPSEFCKVATGQFGCPNYRNGTFLHTTSSGMDQATLFEITLDFNEVFYDISIIPPGCAQGSSLADCKAKTGKVGFNLPMKVNTLHTICKSLECLADGCVDAYHFPDDNSKNTGCRDPDAIFQVVFCPSSNSTNR